MATHSGILAWRLPLDRGAWREKSYDPEISLLGIYPEETKIERDTSIPLFITALFTIARAWKHPRCPLTDEWIKKL